MNPVDRALVDQLQASRILTGDVLSESIEQYSRSASGSNILQFLVTRGNLGIDQARRAIRDSGVQLLKCSGCGEQRVRPTLANVSRARCRQCGSPIEVAEREALEGELLPETDPLIGQHLAHFQIRAVLGTGAMGTVYRAFDTKLARDVAVKVLRNSGAGESGRMSDRFLREARLAAGLEHPNVVRVYEVNDNPEQQYIVSQLVDGKDASQLLEDAGRLAPRRAVQIVLGAARGLRAAHQKGVIHRDMKPSNIMLMRDGSAMVTDFGIARPIEEADGMTLPGEIYGTPAFMSPEQCRDEPLAERTDVYSLGITFYNLLTGVLPYQGSIIKLLRAHGEDKPVPSVADARPDLPPAIVNVVDWMTQKRREDRPATMTQVIEALETIAFGKAETAAVRKRGPTAVSSRKRKLAIGAAALAVGATLAVIAVVLTRQEKPELPRAARAAPDRQATELVPASPSEGPLPSEGIAVGQTDENESRRQALLDALGRLGDIDGDVDRDVEDATEIIEEKIKARIEGLDLKGKVLIGAERYEDARKLYKEL